MRLPSPTLPLVAAVTVGALAACTRHESPAPAAGAPLTAAVPEAVHHAPTAPLTTPAVPTTEAPPSEPAPAASSCIAPWPELPPPTARAAARCPPDSVAAPPKLPPGRVVFVDAPGAPAVDVELARTADHRQRGLMFRTRLGRDAGMLFSWEMARPRQFWMHNTCIPLDMLFIDANDTIVGILEQVPTLNDASRGVPCPARHVLEVNAGYARAAGIRPGQRIRIEE